MRIYALAGTQHNAPFGSTPKLGNCQQLTNPLPIGSALRALMMAMDRWVNEGTLPPPSRIPQVSDGTLVHSHQKDIGFPKISGVRYIGLVNRQLFLDYGLNLRLGKINHHPRQVRNDAYTILLPKVDADGNEVAGIRLPAIRVPLATHTPAGISSVRDRRKTNYAACLIRISPSPRQKGKGKRAAIQGPRLRRGTRTMPIMSGI